MSRKSERMPIAHQGFLYQSLSLASLPLTSRRIKYLPAFARARLKDFYAFVHRFKFSDANAGKSHLYGACDYSGGEMRLSGRGEAIADFLLTQLAICSLCSYTSAVLLCYRAFKWLACLDLMPLWQKLGWVK